MPDARSESHHPEPARAARTRRIGLPERGGACHRTGLARRHARRPCRDRRTGPRRTHPVELERPADGNAIGAVPDQPRRRWLRPGRLVRRSRTNDLGPVASYAVRRADVRFNLRSRHLLTWPALRIPYHIRCPLVRCHSNTRCPGSISAHSPIQSRSSAAGQLY